MSKFTPDPGTLFYADTTRESVRQVGSGDTAVAVKERDRSYAEKVLRCVALDQMVVIAEVAWGQNNGNSRRMLLRSEYEFQPVGPDVAAALGLDTAAKT
jgi:hypothetical protein